MEPSRPILIFDSGVGGLSVLEAVRRALPDETYRYACDNAGFPYGPKPEAELLARVDTVLQALVAAVDPKLLIVACNTASTAVLPRLRERFAFPVIGVVPAIKPAAQLSETGVIGLLATPGTVTRRYTDDLIRDFAAHCDVLRVGSRELVLLAEAKLRGEPVDPELIREILAPFFQDPARSVDTIVLGCTHFPLLKEELQAAAPQVRHWVDSGEAIARRAQDLLREPSTQAGPAKVLFTRMDAGVDALGLALAKRGLEDVGVVPVP